MRAIALRLKPQQDLKTELDAFATHEQVEAACIITGIGSLTRAVLRFAGQSEGTVLDGRFEIVSLSGLLSRHGSHYHMAIADSTGRMIGGHLLQGSLIYTTAEVVIGILTDVRFQREYDAATGYRELLIYELPQD